MHRRKFLKNGSSLACFYPLYKGSHLINFKPGIDIDTEVVKLKIGAVDCTIFRDLQFKYMAKDFFINANPGELNQSLERYKVAPENIPSPSLAVLLQHNQRKILIDTGIGFSENPIVFRGVSHEFKGRLYHLLQRENVQLEEITDVIITHFHPDHIGGIYGDNGQINFPAARFHLHEEEWKYWHSSLSDNQPAMFKFFV